MEKKTCSLKLVADELIGGISLRDFNDRLKLQKTIYMTQVCGVDLGYRFSWYVHGPYSPDLTETAFGYKDRASYFEKVSTSYKITDASKKRLKNVKRLIEADAKQGLDIPSWLELLASIHYLLHIAYLPGTSRTTLNNISERLRAYGKGKFNGNQVNAAWQALENVGLIEKSKLS